MKNIKKTIGAAAVLGMLCAAGTAQATSTVNIAGVAGPVAVLDWSPGTAYAQGGNLATGSTNFPVIIQASLGNFMDASNNVITSNSGLNSSYWVTWVAGMSENITVTPAGLHGTQAFFQGVNAPSYMSVYVTNKAPDAVTGLGYAPATAQSGQTFKQVFAGTIDPASVVGNFVSLNSQHGPANTSTGGYGLLDQNAGGNYWGTQRTVAGAGGTILNGVATAINQQETFFLNGISALDFQLLSTTENVIPFIQAQPSKLVYDGFSNTGLNTVGTLGSVNGFSGTPYTPTGGSLIFGSGNILFQSDGNSAFDVPAGVPEPSTFVLSGLGLLLAGGFLRRRKA